MLKLYYRVVKVGKTDNLLVYRTGTKMQAIVNQEDVKCAEVGQYFSFADVDENSFFK